jgi:hypothetical protein
MVQTPEPMTVCGKYPLEQELTQVLEKRKRPGLQLRQLERLFTQVRQEEEQSKQTPFSA